MKHAASVRPEPGSNSWVKILQAFSCLALLKVASVSRQTAGRNYFLRLSFFSKALGYCSLYGFQGTYCLRLHGRSLSASPGVFIRLCPVACRACRFSDSSIIIQPAPLFVNPFFKLFSFFFFNVFSLALYAFFWPFFRFSDKILKKFFWIFLKIDTFPEKQFYILWQ